MIQDTDGLIILDYLGKNIKEVFENNIDKEIVANAWDYVVKEQHINHLAMGNDKLSSRYFRMSRYFKSRLHVWGIEQETVQQPHSQRRS